jgi:hypothetical protein
MALGKAVMIGAIAALAMPFVMRDETGRLEGLLGLGVVELSLGGTRIAWSWPLFCMITLFAWGFLAWAER